MPVHAFDAPMSAYCTNKRINIRLHAADVESVFFPFTFGVDDCLFFHSDAFDTMDKYRMFRGSCQDTGLLSGYKNSSQVSNLTGFSGGGNVIRTHDTSGMKNQNWK